ncbi:MAG: DMT family transporter [Burkholderiales bacterium]
MAVADPVSPLPASTRALSSGAFITLLSIALMMGANHVGARIAFNNGVDVITAISCRSVVTACVVWALVAWQGVPLKFSTREKRWLPAIGVLIAVQSYCLYSAVARLPVALALLAFNSFPIWIAGWNWLLYRRPPERATLQAMPVILLGLALALDVFGATSDLSAAAHWGQIGTGVAFAFGAAATFGLALVLTQHEAGAVDGRVRTATTMSMVGAIAVLAAWSQGGFHWPQAAVGWWGLAALTMLYGTGITVLFTVLPRLGVAGNSSIMNVEPVFALLLGWLILGQVIAPLQIAGALLVVSAVVWLGLRKK